MFHRTLFKYLISVQNATKSPDLSDAFSTPSAYYIMQEYFRLFFAYEAGHESVDILSYEYAQLLSAILKASKSKTFTSIKNDLLKHQFHTSHLFCEIDEVTLETLSFWQSHNYCWTISNQEPSTSQDTRRSFVDDVIDFVTVYPEHISRDGLKSFLSERQLERGVLHKTFLRFLLKSKKNICDDGTNFTLTKQAKYLVREYCRVLVMDEGIRYRNKSNEALNGNSIYEALINEFSALIYNIQKSTNIGDSIIPQHEKAITPFLTGKFNNLLNSVAENNIRMMENAINDKNQKAEGAKDVHLSQVDRYVEWAIKHKGGKLFD